MVPCGTCYLALSMRSLQEDLVPQFHFFNIIAVKEAVGLAHGKLRGFAGVLSPPSRRITYCHRDRQYLTGLRAGSSRLLEAVDLLLWNRWSCGLKEFGTG